MEKPDIIEVVGAEHFEIVSLIVMNTDTFHFKSFPV